jgi:hypothetical protein
MAGACIPLLAALGPEHYGRYGRWSLVEQDRMGMSVAIRQQAGNPCRQVVKISGLPHDPWVVDMKRPDILSGLLAFTKV